MFCTYTPPTSRHTALWWNKQTGVYAWIPRCDVLFIRRGLLIFSAAPRFADCCAFVSCGSSPGIHLSGMAQVCVADSGGIFSLYTQACVDYGEVGGMYQLCVSKEVRVTVGLMRREQEDGNPTPPWRCCFKFGLGLWYTWPLRALGESAYEASSDPRSHPTTDLNSVPQHPRRQCSRDDCCTTNIVPS